MGDGQEYQVVWTPGYISLGRTLLGEEPRESWVIGLFWDGFPEIGDSLDWNFRLGIQPIRRITRICYYSLRKAWFGPGQFI